MERLSAECGLLYVGAAGAPLERRLLLRHGHARPIWRLEAGGITRLSSDPLLMRRHRFVELVRSASVVGLLLCATGASYGRAVADGWGGAVACRAPHTHARGRNSWRFARIGLDSWTARPPSPHARARRDARPAGGLRSFPAAARRPPAAGDGEGAAATRLRVLTAFVEAAVVAQSAVEADALHVADLRRREEAGGEGELARPRRRPRPALVQVGVGRPTSAS